MDQHIVEVDRLQQLLKDERAQLETFHDGSPEHHEQVGQVLEATRTMVAYEQEIPVLRDIARYRVVRRFIHTIGTATCALTLALGVTAAAGGVSRWYLIPALPLLTAAAIMTGTESGAGRGKRGLRVASAVLTLLVAVVLTLIVLRVISAYWQWAALPALLTAIVMRMAADERMA